MTRFGVCMLVAPVLAGLATVSCPLRAAEDSPPAEFSSQEVRARLMEAQQRIHSIHAACRSGGYSDDYPSGYFAHRVFGAKAPSSLLQISAHGHYALDWRDDPLQQWGYATSQGFIRFDPVSRMYLSTPLEENKSLPGGFETGFFFVATGIWPVDRWPPFRPRGHPYALREVAASDEYEVRPRLEHIDGVWCHVLECASVGDRLWLDVQRGCTLLARELDDPEYHSLMLRYELTEHREFDQGILIPTQIRTIQYNTTAPTEGLRRQKARDATIVLSELQVNSVDEKLFQFDPPPGALRVGPGGEPVQTHPGGREHLQQLASWLQRLSPLPERKPSRKTLWIAVSVFALICTFEGAMRCFSFK